jgi:RNA polymerase sigma factor (TIGR02999 family)
MDRPLADGATGAVRPLDRVFPGLYDELRRLAHAQLARGGPGGTLSTTAVVHEAYLKLAANAGLGFDDRRAFFGLCARAMRQILIDRARARGAAKRDAGAAPAWMPGALPSPDDDRQAAFLLDLDAALGKAKRVDPRLAEVAELRFFAGLTVEETAEVLGVSTPTVKRDTRLARALLARELGLSA